jgi:hypothetical protein
VSDTEYPHCGCADFWPGQGHHPECPVRHKFETLERENAAMRAGITEAYKIIDVLYMDALDNHKESWPRAREWMEQWKEVAK